MYQRPVFAEADLAHLDHLFARDAFATLVTVVDGLPFASHLPMLYRRDGSDVLVEGHWARPNPQARHAGPALMIVHGPHAYVSPGWYPDKDAAARVPTWNYAIAHLHGALEAFEDETGLADLVDRLSQHNEARVGQDWRFEYDRPEMMRQLRGIIGFRFRATRIDMTFKLSQNHPSANVRGAAAGLRALGGEDNLEIAGMMLGHLPPG